MWQCLLIFLGLTLCLQTLNACECGKKPKRSTLLDRSYLTPLSQTSYDPNAIRPATFLTPKLPYTAPFTPNKAITMNYNLASKALQKQGSTSSYSLTESTPNVFAKPPLDPTAKLSDLLSMKLTLKAQKEAIKVMEEQLAQQISEAVRQFGVQDEQPLRKPNELYPSYQQAPSPTNPYQSSPISYGTNELLQLGLKKELEQSPQDSAAAMLPQMNKPLMAQQQMAAYSPYAGYSSTSSNSAASSRYNGGSSSSSLGYQTALG